MKKSLIALAALATVATVAQAQSSVTIYGIVDSGIARATGVNTTRDTTTAVVSGALSTSRLGFKGSEDLGGGLKTNFVLENEFYSDDGTSATKLFNRGSYLELENTPVGLVRLGYQNRLDYAAVASNDPFGASNVGGFVSAGYLGSRNTVTTRVVDAVTLQSAKFNGLSVAYQRQIGGVAGNTNAELTNAYNADYTNGKLRLNATHVKSYSAAPAVQDEKSTSVYATYDFGVASATLGHITNQGASTASKIKTNMVGVKVPVSATGTVVLGFYDITNDTAANSNSTAYSVNYLYALSKRTTLYALFAKSDVEASARPAVSNLPEFKKDVGNATGINQSVSAIGVRHSF